jgi:hypothetical protein
MNRKSGLEELLLLGEGEKREGRKVFGRAAKQVKVNRLA